MRGGTRATLRSIAANVRTTRIARGLTQAMLAERVGFEDRFIQYVEAGERNITIDALVRLAEGLGVEPDRLLKSATSESHVRRPGRPRRRHP